MSSSATPSSGIQTTPSGERRIPQSVRPDGSLRKEIKIRPGYRPPEDVEVYKNRTAESWKRRESEGVPGADGFNSTDATSEGARGKNAKRREARKKAKATGTMGNDEVEGEDGNHAPNGGGVRFQEGQSEPNQISFSAEDVATLDLLQQRPAAPSTEEQSDPDLETEKQARNLKKKLRQARDLKEKKESGESLLPEQLAKVIKIQELIRQLDALGFDCDGAKRLNHVT